MSYTVRNVQKVSVDAESTFGTHAGDFSATGVNIKPKEIIDLSGVFTQMIQDYRNRETRNDYVEAVEGADEVKVSIGHALAGATRAAGDVTEDGLSTWLELINGARDTSVSDVVAASSTTTTLKLTGGGSYSVGDLVFVNGEVRIVTALDIGEITIAPALSNTPSASDLISNMEWFKRSATSALSSFALGITGQDSEFDFLLKGCIAMGVTIDAFKENESIFINAEIEGAAKVRGATITHATTAAPSAPVTCSAGDGVALQDSGGSLWQPCPGELTVTGWVKNDFLRGPGAINGKCGVIAKVPENGEQKVTMTLYQDGTMSKLESLVGTATPIIIQMGTTLEKVIGVAIPNAKVYEYPKTADLENVNAVMVEFNMDQALVFRG